jgi:uncharacterized protein (TIGR00730 family)
MTDLRRICVFCGSSSGVRPVHHEAAADFGAMLAKMGLGLVYGGGRVGLMGILADAVLAAGGEVIGVIPETLLAREVGHASLTELRVVGSMHERKALMAELSDAFVALPGGIGTLEELFEVWSWGLLGLHRKPCGLLNVSGYYNPLMQFIDHALSEKFLRPEHRRMLSVEVEGAALLQRLKSYRPPAVDQWIRRETT